MTQELIVAREGGSFATQIYSSISNPLEFCESMGGKLATVFSLNSPHHGTIMMLTCITEGISVTEYNRRYHGDGTMKAVAIQAEFLRRGGVIEWDPDTVESKDVVRAKFSHPRNQKVPLQLQYTAEDAKEQVREKYDKPGSGWQTNRPAMLRAALIRKAVKIIDPGIIAGFDSEWDFEPDQPVAVVPKTQEAEKVASRREAYEAMSREESSEASAPGKSDQAGTTAKAQEKAQAKSRSKKADKQDKPEKTEEPAATAANEEPSGNPPEESPPAENPSQEEPHGGDSLQEQEEKPCTQEQMAEYVSLVTKLVNTETKKNFTAAEAAVNINKKFNVTHPRELSFSTFESLIEKAKACVARAGT